METIKGYKAFEPGLICKGKQYQENTVFEEPAADLCKAGMHYCTEPLDVLNYYQLVDEDGNMSEFAEVEDLDPAGIEKGNDSKRCTKKLRIGAKISFANLINAAVDVEKIQEEVKAESDESSKEKINSEGDYAQIGSSGDYAQIGSSGDYAKIGSSGYYAQIGSSGDYAQIGSSGDYAQIGSSGDYAKINSTGKNAVVMCAGHGSRAKAEIGSWITLAEWNDKGEPVAVVTKKVDGVEVKEDTYYRLKNGEFEEVFFDD